MLKSAVTPDTATITPNAVFARSDIARIFEGDPLYGIPGPKKASRRFRFLSRKTRQEDVAADADVMKSAAECGAELARITKTVLAPEVDQLISGLSLLGALGGYACSLVAARAALSQSDDDPQPCDFAVMAHETFGNRYTGAHVNAALYEDPISFWSLIVGAATKLGHGRSSRLLDLAGLNRHTDATAQTAEFGLPRMPLGLFAPDLPVNFVRHLWPEFLPVLKRYSNGPDGWALAFGFAVQELIAASEEKVTPRDMAQIVMEFAFPMSRVGPDFLNQASAEAMASA